MLTHFGRDAAVGILAFHGPHAAREPCGVHSYHKDRRTDCGYMAVN